MCAKVNSLTALFTGFALAILAHSIAAPPVFAEPADAPEFRGVWVDTWGNGFLSASQIDTLVNTCRTANINAIFPEVRKVADAYYVSSYEPRATNIIDPPPFDPLQYLIDRCHDTSGGKTYIEVHPWLVTFRIWASGAPPGGHVVNLHPDWVTLDNAGNNNYGGTYFHDPGHPQAAEYTANVFLDVVQRYDVDGIHFDYVRYNGNTWGYNPVAVSRFNTLYGRSGQPVYNDADWMQFRRDQVTAVVRKVYAKTVDIKPQVKVSAATVNWGYSNSDFTKTTAYIGPLQDWNGWMMAHILDMNCLMNYANEQTYYTRYRDWINFTVANRNGRHAIIGQGSYMNTINDSMAQLLAARSRSAQGTMIYSYRSTNNEGRPASDFWNALRTQVYTGVAPVPDMPWKSAPTQGIFKGTVTNGSAEWLDGAAVSIDGTSFSMETDGTGFYAFMDVPPGTYTLRANSDGYAEGVATGEVIVAGDVTTVDFVLGGGAPPEQYICDNSDSGFSVLSGTWGTSTFGNIYGPNKRYSTRGTGSGEVRWTFSGIPAGDYRVEFWVNNSTYAADAHYTISHDGGDDEVIANQFNAGDGWHSLGIFHFSSGSPAVTLSDYWAGDGTYVVADAIRLTLVNSAGFWFLY